MLQAVAIPTPPTPPSTPQQGRDLGDAIRKTVDDALAGALAPARAELVEEIASMSAERDALRTAMRSTSDRGVRRDLERRIERLDERIEQAQEGLEKIEDRLGTTVGPVIAGPGIATTASPTPMPPMDPFDSFNPAPMVISIMAILFIGFPLAITFARVMWRRASGKIPPAVTLETARRFDRLEQSVDAIAIEIERISENQRYLTKVLSEPKQGASVGSGVSSASP